MSFTNELVTVCKCPKPDLCRAEMTFTGLPGLFGLWVTETLQTIISPKHHMFAHCTQMNQQTQSLALLMQIDECFK